MCFRLIAGITASQTYVCFQKLLLLLHCRALIFVELRVCLLQRPLILTQHHMYETSPGAFTSSKQQYLDYPLDQALSG